MAESKHFLKYTPIYAEKNFVQLGKEIYNSYQLNKKPNFFLKTGEPSKWGEFCRAIVACQIG
jgi:hypothetical protein